MPRISQIWIFGFLTGTEPAPAQTAVTCASARRPATRRNAWDQYVAAFNPGKGWTPPFLAAVCHEQTSGSRYSRATARRSGQSSAGQEETGECPWYRWAKHPAIAGSSVHHVQAVSSRATPSPRLAARAHEALLLLHA